MRVYIEGVGLIGPGLCGWAVGCPVVAGHAAYCHAPTVFPDIGLLPAAERRRAGTPVRLALAAGVEAFTNARRDPATTAMVFTSSGGDGDNVHHLCDTLASTQREVSPTRFHNSVHNAAAGYWSIATRSHEPSTSLCAYDASFSAGLLEAVAQTVAGCAPVALIAYDHAYPEPLHTARTISASFGVGFVMTPQITGSAFAEIELAFGDGVALPSAMTDRNLEALRAGVPAARCLPLLAVLANSTGGTVDLDIAAGSHLSVTVRPCA